jgi:GAF domain-containing protein
MAVSDAQSDPRQAADIAESVGYVPDSILCVPLFYEDQTIGVLELLDKHGAPSFSAADMEALGLFANQAAVAIEQSRVHRNLAALLGDALKSLASASDGEEEIQRRARAFAASVAEDPRFGLALELARLVAEISSQGENETQACRAILRGFAEYLRLRPDAGGELGGIG